MGKRIQCRYCEEIIESMHRHDFVWCKCGTIFIDGGNDYTRIGGNLEDIIEVDEALDTDTKII